MVGVAVTDADLLRQQRRIASARAGLRRIETRLFEIEVEAPKQAMYRLWLSQRRLREMHEWYLADVWRIIRDERRRRKEEESR